MFMQGRFVEDLFLLKPKSATVKSFVNTEKESLIVTKTVQTEVFIELV